MKFALIILSLLFINRAPARTALALTPRQTVKTVKSFNQWKHGEIQYASQVLNTSRRSHEKLIKSLKLLKKQDNALIAQRRLLEAQVAQNEWNLEAAQDLQVTDYAALYLSQQKGADKLKAAAIKLNSQETVKILEAYLQVLQRQQEDRKKSPMVSRGGLSDPM